MPDILHHVALGVGNHLVVHVMERQIAASIGAIPIVGVTRKPRPVSRGINQVQRTIERIGIAIEGLGIVCSRRDRIPLGKSPQGRVVPAGVASPLTPWPPLPSPSDGEGRGGAAVGGGGEG